MKKTLILLILILSTCTAYGEKSIVTDNPCQGCGTNGQYKKIIDSLSQVPTKIQFILNTLLKQSMTDFTGNINFVQGVNFDLENWLGNDSIPQSQNEHSTPKYQLYYQLSDESLKIKAYCIKIELDSYGQVTYFGWPREGYNKREKFVKPETALELALKQCKIKKYKTNKYSCCLGLDSKLEKLCWYIYFEQKTEGNKRNSRTDYIRMVIDATELKILDEVEESESLLRQQ